MLHKTKRLSSCGPYKGENDVRSRGERMYVQVPNVYGGCAHRRTCRNNVGRFNSRILENKQMLVCVCVCQKREAAGPVKVRATRP